MDSEVKPPSKESRRTKSGKRVKGGRGQVDEHVNIQEETKETENKKTSVGGMGHQ